MQIPPTTALLNLMASLPAQGASATAAPPASAKSVPQVADQPPGNERPVSGFLPRGSVVNILA